MRVIALLVLMMSMSLSCLAKDKEDGLIIASGFGTVDLHAIKIKAQAKMMARRAAIVDAQRNLSERIKGVRLTGGTTMEEYEISNDVVATRVKALLTGAFEYDQIVTEDEQSIAVEMVLAVCINKLPAACQNQLTLEDLEQFINNQAPAVD